ncbi:MAG: ParB/RepB/Spo0J family partition protein [Acidibacillus sp.]|uniref:Stage 0 sporulation protein J n=1 Tax=Sulfoacidibacillus ferrooxidans TaxID=2005001 RepID=A0A9X1V8K9_9BACL|nr:ParB/RepB/Spo0J family partition protein [Sulfoacidibacillus ferrooxidans]MCI0183288.1 Stage 0 sporulation protein J [Sulfoacidibacillus ferrooxidans]MCY0894033.1 ParB/RepB/Spo0J family partition protein [Acidibacillus sp.]
MKSKGGLGKGLEALLPQISTDATEEVVQVRLDELRPNPYQPRREFNQDKLNELMESIKEHGILQPIIVRRGIGRGYEIIAGERRFRAMQMLQEETMAAIVRQISDREAMEIALIENLQREDLSPIEVAEAYAKIMEHFSLTQEQLAIRVGQSRSHVANLLRLLGLPSELRENVSRGTISMGHARALLSIGDVQTQHTVAQKIIDDGLTVRAVEQLVHRLQLVSRETKPKSQNNAQTPITKAYEEQLRNILGTSVRIQMGKKRGKIEIEYFSSEDLERILQLLNGQR